MNDGDKLVIAFQEFDAANDEDPRKISRDGENVGQELFYARKLTEWVMRLEPDASDVLRLASRCQHLKRWESSRIMLMSRQKYYERWAMVRM